MRESAHGHKHFGAYPDWRAHRPRSQAQPGPTWRLLWLRRAFALFNSACVFAYLPTLWAIYSSGDSSRHSLITWRTWMFANLSMGLWLRERDGQMHGAVVVNLFNSLMCFCGVALILWYRL